MKTLTEYKVVHSKRLVGVLLSFLSICLILAVGNAYVKQQDNYRNEIIELKQTITDFKVSSDKEIKVQKELVTKNKKSYDTQLMEVIKELKTTNKTIENVNSKLLTTTKDVVQLRKDYNYSQSNKASRGNTVREAVTPSMKATVKKKLASKVTGKTFSCSAYTLAECGKSKRSSNYGITASGARVRANYTIAMGKKYPFGTRVKIEGFSATFVCQDRGGAVGNNNIDIYFTSLTKALNFGRRRLKVTIL